MTCGTGGFVEHGATAAQVVAGGGRLVAALHLLRRHDRTAEMFFYAAMALLGFGWTLFQGGGFVFWARVLLLLLFTASPWTFTAQRALKSLLCGLSDGK